MVTAKRSPKKSGQETPPAGDGLCLASVLFRREKSSRTAVVSPEQSAAFSYAELSRMAKDLAIVLQHQGLQPRDRVAILLPTSIEFVAALFGTLAAGAAVLPLDIYMKRADLLGVLDRIQPTVLVTNPSLHRKIGQGHRPMRVCFLEFHNFLTSSFLDSNGSRVHSASGLDGSVPSRSWKEPEIAPEDDAVLILSSGSTGLPKAVRLSHRAVLRNVSMNIESFEIAEDICGLQVLPMNYSYGLNACFLSILHSGGTVVLQPTLEPGAVLATLKDYDVNLIMGTPAIFQYLIEKAPASSDLQHLPVRYLTLGGDRCRRYALNLVQERLPVAKPYITYGLTEAGPRVSTLPPRFVRDCPASIGFPLRSVAVSIRDEQGKICAPGTKGEIVVNTPSLMNGYFDDPARTKKVIRDGLCYTGDIGYLDSRGFLYCLGRKDRQFKMGGRMVDPSLIEQCIASHPLVRDVRVAKMEDGREEWIHARVRTSAAPLDNLQDELRKHCRKRMPIHLVPGEFQFEPEDHYYHKGKVFSFAQQAAPTPRA